MSGLLKNIFSAAVLVSSPPGAPGVPGCDWDLMGHQQCNLQAHLAGDKERD